MKFQSVAYVASTLPIEILKNNIKNWNLNEVIIASDFHFKTYNYLLKNTNVKITIVPKGFFKNFIFLFLKILSIKYKKKQLLFFHECCCINFDLIINILNPKAIIYPQVTLNSFDEANSNDISFTNKESLLIKFFFQYKNFKPWKIPKDNGKGYAIVWSCIKYSSNIDLKDLKDSYRLKNRKKTIDFSSNKILILVAQDFCSEAKLKNVFTLIINKLVKQDFEVFIKDHPNPESRLNLKTNLNTKLMNSEIPIELLDDNYKHVIGFCSTSLLFFENRAISLIHLLDEDKMEIKKRKSHLLSLPKGNEIFYPKTMEELFKIIK